MGEQNNQNKNNGGDLLKVRRDKLAELQAAGNDPYMVNTSARDTLNKDISDNFEKYENQTVTIAGRIMSKRGKGKVMFMDVYDRTGKMQVFAKFDDLGEETYKVLKSGILAILWNVQALFSKQRWAKFLFTQQVLSFFQSHFFHYLKSIMA